MSEPSTNAESKRPCLDPPSGLRGSQSRRKSAEKACYEEKLCSRPSLRVSKRYASAAQTKAAPPQVHEVVQQRFLPPIKEPCKEIESRRGKRSLRSIAIKLQKI